MTVRRLNDVIPQFSEDYRIQTFDNPHDLINSADIFSLVFLDIQMDDLNGIETAKKIMRRNSECRIFFITNYDDYLDDAFDTHAFRYWRKPVDMKRLKSGIASALRNSNTDGDYIDIAMGKDTVRLHILRIMAVVHVRRKTEIYTTNGDFSTYDTFANVAKRLTQPYFVKTGKGSLVNMHYVQKFSNNEVICLCGDSERHIPISRRNVKDFVKLFAKWSGNIK